jgi:hypothetical protein
MHQLSLPWACWRLEPQTPRDLELYKTPHIGGKLRCTIVDVLEPSRAAHRITYRSPLSSTTCGLLSYDLENSTNLSMARRVALHPRSRSRVCLSGTSLVIFELSQAISTALGCQDDSTVYTPLRHSHNKTSFRLLKAFWVRARVTGDFVGEAQDREPLYDP